MAASPLYLHDGAIKVIEENVDTRALDKFVDMPVSVYMSTDVEANNDFFDNVPIQKQRELADIYVWEGVPRKDYVDYGMDRVALDQLAKDIANVKTNVVFAPNSWLGWQELDQLVSKYSVEGHPTYRKVEMAPELVLHQRLTSEMVFQHTKLTVSIALDAARTRVNGDFCRMRSPAPRAWDDAREVVTDYRSVKSRRPFYYSSGIDFKRGIRFVEVDDEFIYNESGNKAKRMSDHGLSDGRYLSMLINSVRNREARRLTIPSWDCIYTDAKPILKELIDRGWLRVNTLDGSEVC